MKIRGTLALVSCALLSGLAGSGCAGRYQVDPPPAGFDAAIVLGCPNEKDGSLSRCQVSRAVWAAEMWRRGKAQHFITSGAAVHTPWVEAESLAAAMEALGVPAERIYLETEALHTDENVYNGLRLAGTLGMRRVAVISNKGHAAWACDMARDWKHECATLNVDTGFLEAHQQEFTPRLQGLSLHRVPDGDWVPLDERERQRARALGRSRRPPSALLYPYMGLLRLFGRPWMPQSPVDVPAPITWAERRGQLASR